MYLVHAMSDYMVYCTFADKVCHYIFTYCNCVLIKSKLKNCAPVYKLTFKRVKLIRLILFDKDQNKDNTYISNDFVVIGFKIVKKGKLGIVTRFGKRVMIW